MLEYKPKFLFLLLTVLGKYFLKLHNIGTIQINILASVIIILKIGLPFDLQNVIFFFHMK